MSSIEAMVKQTTPCPQDGVLSSQYKYEACLMLTKSFEWWSWNLLGTIITEKKAGYKMFQYDANHDRRNVWEDLRTKVKMLEVTRNFYILSLCLQWFSKYMNNIYNQKKVRTHKMLCVCFHFYFLWCIVCTSANPGQCWILRPVNTHTRTEITQAVPGWPWQMYIKLHKRNCGAGSNRPPDNET